MRDSIKTYLFIAVLCALAFSSCKKEPEASFILNDVELYPNAAGKTKIKSNEQYVAILHANLFQTALSANDIFEINNCIESIGDKELAREVIISNFMNDSDVILPTVDEMNTDIDAFITETYVRFLVRYPTEAEKEYVRNFIITNPYVTPEIVYFSFALSNEYMYY
ncbi:MAG: hypothetical protein P8H59_02230 [Flavobacteriales bacterium]|nr:hypothetical protein [Flavobacteriales bacterium]MDG1779742.1 hypothetical protein [Flavobacteriales bacterium]MDG2247197.1 hypothetical protein [Flavobacteriales bacterium]